MNAKDLIAGAFVFFSFLLFAGFVAWGGGLRGVLDRRPRVEILLERGVPLEIGAAVRIEGVKVGEVVAARPRSPEERRRAHPERALALTIALDRGIQLTKASRAVVRSDGLLGARYVDLRLGAPGGEPLPEGAPLLGVLGGIDSFLEKGHVLAAALGRLATDLEALLAPAGGPGSLPALLRTLDRLSGDARATLGRLDQVLAQADGLLAEGRGAVTGFETLVRGPDARLPALLDASRRLVGRTEATVGDLRQLVGETRPKLMKLLDELDAAVAGTRDAVARTGERADEALTAGRDLVLRNDRNIFLLLHNLRVAAEELKLLAARLRADPSQLLFGGSESPAEAEAAARRSLERDLLERGQLPPRRKR